MNSILLTITTLATITRLLIAIKNYKFLISIFED
jgi:hypothetical protein